MVDVPVRLRRYRERKRNLPNQGKKTSCGCKVEVGFKVENAAYLYDMECVGSGLKAGVSKIGITNRTPRVRAAQYGCKPGYGTHQRARIRFDDGALCCAVESHIKRTYKADRYVIDYDGPAFLGNGMTEVFTRDVFSLWLASEHGIATLATPGVTVEMLGGQFLDGTVEHLEDLYVDGALPMV